MCKHTPSTDVKPRLPAGDTGLEDIPQAQISPEEEEESPGDTQPIVPPATTQPEAEEEPQDEGQEEPSKEERDISIKKGADGGK